VFRNKVVLVCLVLITVISVGLALEIRTNRKRPIIELREGSLYYDGWIADAGAQRLIALYEAQEIKPTLLRIRSVGGGIDAGMELGEFIHRNQIAVHVVDYCMSSCANYVFTAGKYKVLSPGALVAWHGSAIQKIWRLSRDSHKRLKEKYVCESQETCESELAEIEKRLIRGYDASAYLAAARARQRAFFDSIGVDEAVTVYGQDVVECRCTWTFSIDDMQHFNINDVREERVWYLPQFSLQAWLHGRYNDVVKLKLPKTDARPSHL
jgi:hypothetical protein